MREGGSNKTYSSTFALSFQAPKKGKKKWSQSMLSIESDN